MKKNTINSDLEFGIDSRYETKKEREQDSIALMQARLERMKNLTKEEILSIKVEKEQKIYIVLSRDSSSFIYCTSNLEKANEERLKQIKDEEMGGGRPSVYIKETILND